MISGTAYTVARATVGRRRGDDAGDAPGRKKRAQPVARPVALDSHGYFTNSPDTIDRTDKCRESEATVNRRKGRVDGNRQRPRAGGVPGDDGKAGKVEMNDCPGCNVVAIYNHVLKHHKKIRTADGGPILYLPDGTGHHGVADFGILSVHLYTVTTAFTVQSFGREVFAMTPDGVERNEPGVRRHQPPPLRVDGAD